MAIGAEFRDHVVEMLGPLGAISARAMFGGAGLYLDGTIFGLIAGDILYLKVDDTNRADYENAGSVPFTPFADKPYAMSYWEVPDAAMDAPEVLCAWARKSWECGRRAAKAKRSRRK